jgi:UDP-N-acetylmuramate--alanine ligase
MTNETDWGGRRLHFIAIGGAGMSALALIAQRLGAAVTGSDRAETPYLERLRAAGLEPRVGHDAEAVPAEAEIVVSTAIGEANPELVRAREREQRVIHRGELLAEVSALRPLIAVAGTHGKTTTAGMIVHALRGLGLDPAFVLGGELPGAGPDGGRANAGWGSGDWIVAEADESDGSFLRLAPRIAVVTNVELEHHDRWASRTQLLDAFAEFVAPAEGVSVHASGSLDPVLDGLGPDARVLRFGAESLPRWEEPGRGEGFDPGPLELATPGAHNRLNAAAALAALSLAGAEVGGAREALASFPGMVRRLEFRGEREGARIYDDYAHHPTEVAAALAALRELRPERLIAVFQPHLYSRTKALAREFGAALAAGADEVAVLEVYPAREEPVGPLAGVSGSAVAAAAAERAGGRPVWWLPTIDAAERALAPRLGPGDILVTLGAGDVDGLAARLIS